MKEALNIRELAVKTLYEIEFNGAFSNIALKDALSKNEMTKQEKDFFTCLVYGALDKKLTLDYIIGKFSKVKLKKISKFILIILRIGIYQLKFMDSVPESAAVNESVKLARRYGHSASAGFVNGLLRTASKTEITYPEDRREYLSVKYSFPINMCEKWVNDFGFEFTEALMKAFEQPSDLILRANTLKITAQELVQKLADKGIKSEITEYGVKADGFDIASDELYKSGYYTVQDTAAMQPAILMAPKSGEYVIDMCAAPGGKITHMAELMGNEGKIEAFDIYEHKIELIKKNALRLGIDIIEAQMRDASMYYEEFSEKADKVLCDVPCTGTGIIGRKPDIKHNRRESSDIADIQKKILSNGAKYLKSGGELVYSTCSIEKEENEDVVNAFLAENDRFEKIYEKTYYPHIDNCDGFYVCKMKKND